MDENFYIKKRRRTTGAIVVMLIVLMTITFFSLNIFKAIIDVHEVFNAKIMAESINGSDSLSFLDTLYTGYLITSINDATYISKESFDLVSDSYHKKVRQLGKGSINEAKEVEIKELENELIDLIVELDFANKVRINIIYFNHLISFVIFSLFVVKISEESLSYERLQI